MSALGQKQTLGLARSMSAIPPKADIAFFRLDKSYSAPLPNVPVRFARCSRAPRKISSTASISIVTSFDKVGMSDCTCTGEKGQCRQVGDFYAAFCCVVDPVGRSPGSLRL